LYNFRGRFDTEKEFLKEESSKKIYNLPQDVASVLFFAPTEQIYLKKSAMAHDFKSKHGTVLFKNLSMNKETMINIKRVTETYPIPCDFDGKNLLLMNNFVDKKNKFRQKLTMINLETRETINIPDKIEKMRLGVFTVNGFVMVQEQSEVIYFNVLGRNLRVMKGMDEKGYFTPDRAVRLMMDEFPEDEKNNMDNHGSHTVCLTPRVPLDQETLV
jgi:hypothetical protein